MKLKHLAIGLAFGVPFGLLTAMGYDDELTIASVLVGGALGVAATVVLALYAAWSGGREGRQQARLLAPYQADGIVHHGRATLGREVATPFSSINVTTGLPEYHGWLVLTKRQLVYIPGRTSAEHHLKFPLTAILGTQPWGTPNHILVALATGPLELKVDRADIWLGILTATISVARSAESA